MARGNGDTKAEWLAKEVAKAVNSGKAWDCETVDFADPNRPPTCLEVDFPILPINQIAAIEGNSRQYCPGGNEAWAKSYPSMFNITDGTVGTAALDGPGLGYQTL